MADDHAIPDERVGQVLGVYARMAHRIIADPARWMGADDELPDDAGIPAKVLDELHDRAFGEVTPASPTWDDLPLRRRVRWWTRRIGVTAGLAAAAPRVAGALADRVPLQAALGASAAGLAVCATAREHGVTDAAAWVPLLGTVLLGRDLAPHEGQADAEAEAELEESTPTREEAHGLGAGTRRAVGALWRLARQIWELESVLDERPRGNLLFRAVAKVPVVGLPAGWLDENGGIRRASRETAELLDKRVSGA